MKAVVDQTLLKIHTIRDVQIPGVVSRYAFAYQQFHPGTHASKFCLSYLIVFFWKRLNIATVALFNTQNVATCVRLG